MIAARQPADRTLPRWRDDGQAASAPPDGLVPARPHAARRPRPAPLAGHKVAVVIVTRDRPVDLARCLAAIRDQTSRPASVLIVDNASERAETAAVAAAFPGAIHARMPANLGGAGGFRAGIELALAAGADLVWLMDDDGRPADPRCLERLLAAAAEGAAIAAPLVADIDAPDRLAFPIRLAGRTRFRLAEVAGRARIDGFAHLFNGALIRASVFARIGLPEPRLFIRGDEVEFLYRALRAGLAVRIETAARFLHPGSAPEIHPIMFGLFYATEPATEFKRYCQFRNRGHIFRAYGMWSYLAADVVRYGWYYLINRRGDLDGLARWLRATAAGWRGDFLRAERASPRPPEAARAPAD